MSLSFTFQDGKLVERDSSTWQLQGDPTVLITLAHIFNNFAPLMVSFLKKNYLLAGLSKEFFRLTTLIARDIYQALPGCRRAWMHPYLKIGLLRLCLCLRQFMCLTIGQKGKCFEFVPSWFSKFQCYLLCMFSPCKGHKEQNRNYLWGKYCCWERSYPNWLLSKKLIYRKFRI